MPPEPHTLAGLIGGIQVIAGLVLVVVLLTALYRSGQLRRAFAFPAAAPNTLTGAHLLLVLAAFYAAMLLVSSVLQVARPALPPAPPTATAPAESRPIEAPEVSTTQPAAAASEPAASQPTAPKPDDEVFNLVVHGATEVIVLAVILNLVLSTFTGGLADFGLRIDRLGRDLFRALVGYLAFWPICAGIAEGATWLVNVLVPSWTPPPHKVLVFLEEPGLSLLWGVLAWVLAGLIAPIFEEILFRGLLLTWVRKASGSTWLAIAISGLAFGVIHVPQWHLVPALTALGLVLGYLYARTGSLTLVILFHAIFNLRTLALTALAGPPTP
jgi:membrane protease YdiL (CAAX protease family)